MTTISAPGQDAPFGTSFASAMGSVVFAGGRWAVPGLGPLEPVPLHPASHVLHYSSSCFEGVKAHRGVDGKVRVFRLADHVERMRRSARVLHLPIPDHEMLAALILDVVSANLDEVPSLPGALYIRPTLIGTEANIGAAAAPSGSALLYVICSRVGDFFAGGFRPLRISIETDLQRTTPHFGTVKSGVNYAMALGITMSAKEKLDVDQILFAPGGEVQETGAANFVLIDAQRIVTPQLTEAFLHGVTRDSVLRLGKDMGYEVEERALTVDEVIGWVSREEAEAALSGTAAVLAPVGTLVHKGEDVIVGSGQVGPNTRRLRNALTDIQAARAPDTHGWLSKVG